MTYPDLFKIGVSGRLTPRLLSDQEEPLMVNLGQFAQQFDLPEIVPALCRCIELNTGFHVGYMLIRPASGIGRDLPDFADLSAFDDHFTGSGFDLLVHEDGLEIFAVVSDRHDRRGRINIGLNIGGRQPDELRSEIQKLTDALSAVIAERQQDAQPQKDKSLATLIHQVRNPLATILISASQMAMKTNDKYDDDDRMLVDFINSESERIEYFLSRYSRYANIGKPERKETEVAALIEILQAVSAGKGLNIAYTVSDSLTGARLLLDRDQLDEAFQQILQNSMEAGAAKIQIILKREGNFTKIIFSDNGTGIRPEMLRKVKEPFYSTKDGGSGLGIPIAEKIVSAHGGDLRLEQAAPQGLTVIISLPCK